MELKKKNSELWKVVLIIMMVISGCDSSDSPNELCILMGDFDATIIEAGELLAVKAKPILMPYVGWKYGWQFKITEMVEHGWMVSAGDTVVKLDPASIQRFLTEEENKLEVEQANLNKLIVEQANKSKTLEASLKEFQANYNLKKLELEKFEFESKRKKEIKDLEFQQANLHLNRIISTVELEKSISKNDMKIQHIKVAQMKRNIEEAQSAIRKMTIRSPIDGLFQVSRNRRFGKLYRVGDDTYQGAEIALVPDLSKIKVVSTIHETDIGKVKPGQKVIIRLEAFPDKAFQGKISDLGKLSYKKEEKSNVKVFDSEIVLEQSDPLLKPGMTVSCEIFYAELENVLYVDNSCLKKVDGTFYLCMKEKDTWEDRPVEIGPRNNKYTVVYGNLEKGTELMIPVSEGLALNQ